MKNTTRNTDPAGSASTGYQHRARSTHVARNSRRAACDGERAGID
jgi:hypothetical protein